MRSSYINLNAATERRHAIEASFAAARFSPAWQLRRFPALGVEHPLVRQTPGRITPTEKACFLSHMHCLRSALAEEGHLFVLEDDAEFCAGTEAVLNTAISRLDGAAWDIIYTDLIVTRIEEMIQLFLRHRDLSAKGAVDLFDLRMAGPFVGATAYVVNRRSKGKLADVWGRGARVLDAPADVFLSDRVHDGTLRAFLLFPFATSVSSHAHKSQLREANTVEVLWNIFRQLVWMGADLTVVEATLAQMGSHTPDSMAVLLGKMIGMMLSDSTANFLQRNDVAPIR